MFSLINRQVDDLRPGSTVGEKKQKKTKKKRQALAPIANRKKIRTNKQTNKRDGNQTNQASSLEVVSGTGRREVLRMRCR